MLAVRNLRTEYKVNPIGMDEPAPRFSYTLENSRALQTARRIRVQDESGRMVWDSGRVESGETVQIVYAGEILRPFTVCTWSVEVETDEGETAESPSASFETGFLSTGWTGKWIFGKAGIGPYRPASRLAREFHLAKKVRRARLYSTALGLYSAFLNGREITQNRLTPGWSQYYDHVQYQAYDVTDFLSEGANVLAALVGDGWYCGVISYVGSPEDKHGYGTRPLFRAELRIEYEDGTAETIGTDRTWSSFFLYQALLSSDIYLGEEYDAMFDDTTWKMPGFLQKGPCPVPAVEEYATAALVWQSGADVRCIRELAPVSVVKHPAGTWIVDFGENIAGVERIRIPGSHPGAVIVIRHGEMLNPDGTLYRDHLLFAQQTTTLTCGKSENLVYTPRFTYYGFRYLEISGWPGELDKSMICAQVLSSDLPRTGNFSCSNELVNKLYSNIIRSQQGNFIDVPTDCPQRCERFGWTGDAQVFADTATWNFYAPEFFTKWIYDLNASRDQATGAYPILAPNPAQPHSASTPSAGWSDAGIVCPWVLFRKYGDLRTAARGLKGMARYLDCQTNRSGSWIVNETIGDHLNLNSFTSKALIATAYLYEMTRLTARIARFSGDEKEADIREKNLPLIRRAFTEKFFSPEGELLEKTQTAAAMVIVYGLAPTEEAFRKTVQFLVQDIRDNRNLHLSTGFLGTPILLRALTLGGELELAYALLEQTTYPSWLYPVTQGATTIWERWNGWTSDKGFFDPGMNSFNHYAYGAVGAWLFDTVCGICYGNEEDFSSRAFRNFRLAPRPGGTFSHAEASFLSSCGKIESAWTRKNGSVDWKFTVPCNSMAEIVFPGSVESPEKIKGISFDGKRFLARPGVYEFRNISETNAAKR